MQRLVERAREYALSRGVELLIVDGAATGRWIAARDGPCTLLVIDAGTADSPRCGDVVYRACEAISAARDLEINIHLPVPTAPAAPL